MRSDFNFEKLCEWGIVYSLCATIFVLPASIGLLNSFAALSIFFYLIKKISRIFKEWPVKASALSPLGKIDFIWKSFGPPDNFLNRPLQILILGFIISVIFSQYPSLSAKAFVGKFLKCLFLYFTFLEVFTDQKRIGIFVKVFLCSAFITALDAVYQHYTGVDFIAGRHIGIENSVSTKRISASFFGANGFGAYLLPVIALVVQFLYLAVVRFRSWLLGGGLAVFLTLLLFCLCWTYSRSSWVGFLVILAVMTLMNLRKFLFSAILILVFIFFFLPLLNQIRHVRLTNDDVNVSAPSEIHPKTISTVLDHGGSGRRAYWKKAVSIIQMYPLSGSGLNTYTRILKREVSANGWWYAHNCYLQLAAETGLMGLGCFLWMLFVLIINGFKNCHSIKDEYLSTLLQGTIAGLFGFLVQSFFDNTFYTVQLSMMMWLMFGLVVSIIRCNAHE